ncbi:hypothetical protein NAT51_18540 [Flavobacterium amniphilum]|uniref:hypothetical protein n=1 Tax=Flavobacterium amniphilum TaxID=1834035 RepID=UPI00202A8290|nr:hypothetical protein [Flavobacterium amniphilum]MCL9807529.1 hypothetical protein [Flavobacterium amniphilum]
MHEWDLDKKLKPSPYLNDLGELINDEAEPIHNLITWVYQERTFVSSAKIQGEERFSIISDYIGRPVQAYNENGSLIWQTEYDIYGKLRNLQGDEMFVPFGERTWWRIEKPALLKNKNVKNIFRRNKAGGKTKNGHIKCR